MSDDEPTPEIPETPEEALVEEPAAESQTPESETPPAEEPIPETPAVQEPVAEQPAEEPVAEQSVPGTAVPSAEAAEIAGAVEDAPLEAFEEAQQASAEAEIEEQAPAATEAESEMPEEDEEDLEEPTPRVKPSVPGAHLEVDIVPEGVDPLGRNEPADPYAIEEDDAQAEGEAEEEETLSEPISTAAIDLAADARYRATGKRKTAVARVILRPGSGEYKVNGRTLEQHFTRDTLQRNIRQPLETVGYQDRMDVVARLHGGGISAQAGALRHGISRALLEADPNLRGELKRRGFLTRDSRAKERKKAGLKKARKRPQFSKR
jgi:small subunit ribosomal protein S9